jgi:hypothetical protein
MITLKWSWGRRWSHHCCFVRDVNVALGNPEGSCIKGFVRLASVSFPSLLRLEWQGNWYSGGCHILHTEMGVSSPIMS